MAKKKLNLSDFGEIEKIKKTKLPTEKITESFTDNFTDTEISTEKITELRNKIKSKRSIIKTKQTISIEKVKHKKLKKYLDKNGLTFQSLMTQLIDIVLEKK